MGYYLRVLGKTDNIISLRLLREGLIESNLKATLDIENEREEDWNQIILKHINGTPIALIEKSLITDKLGREEIEELLEGALCCKPVSAVKWLTTFLPNVKVIYSFQILKGADSGKGWNIIDEIKSLIWNEVEGIFQADQEGFTNEDGYHILWQFSDSVSGQWNMAVLNSEGNWNNFNMDLSDTNHRKAFFEGKIPSEL